MIPPESFPSPPLPVRDLWETRDTPPEDEERPKEGKEEDDLSAIQKGNCQCQYGSLGLHS